MKKIGLRAMGILVLCLLIGGALGAWAAGTEEEPLPQLQVLVSEDAVFASLVDQIDQLEGKTPKNRTPSVAWVEDSTPLFTVIDDGIAIADIFIDPQWLGEYLRPLPEDEHFLGLVRAYEGFALRCKGEFAEGDYYVWMANADGLGLELTFQIGWFTIEMHWFMTLVNSEGEIVAILYPPDDNFYTPEAMLRAMGGDHPIISLLTSCEVPEPGIEPPEPPPPPPPPFP